MAASPPTARGAASEVGWRAAPGERAGTLGWWDGDAFAVFAYWDENHWAYRTASWSGADPPAGVLPEGAADPRTFGWRRALDGSWIPPLPLPTAGPRAGLRRRACRVTGLTLLALSVAWGVAALAVALHEPDGWLALVSVVIVSTLPVSVGLCLYLAAPPLSYGDPDTGASPARRWRSILDVVALGLVTAGGQAVLCAWRLYPGDWETLGSGVDDLVGAGGRAVESPHVGDLVLMGVGALGFVAVVAGGVVGLAAVVQPASTMGRRVLGAMALVACLVPAKSWIQHTKPPGVPTPQIVAQDVRWDTDCRLLQHGRAPSGHAADPTDACVLAGVDLSGADLSGANLLFGKLAGANLSHTNLTNATLRGANLSHTNLTDARVAGANLSDANLTNADLTGADLTDVDLTGANLTSADLTRVTWDGTTCPDGHNSSQLSPQTCAGHGT